MAQTGFTPIQLYSTSTAAAAPVAGNLTNSTLGSELAINITDGKLFYKDNANAVQVIGWKVVPATAGGTGQTSYAVGDLLYADTTTSLAKLADVATGNALISGGVGVAPAWGKIGLTTHVSGTLPVANGGTGTATAFTAGSVVFAGASGVYSQDNTNFFWDDTNKCLGIGAAPNTAYKINASGNVIFGNAVDITPNNSWAGQVTVTANGYAGGLAFDATGMWVGHNSAARVLILATNETERMRIDGSGLVTVASGGGLSISATAVTSPAAGNGNVFSGTYTPSLTNTTNIAASTASVCQYMRVGNVVTVSGTVTIDPTATGQIVLGMTLPIASNFSGATNCGGTFVGSGVTTVNLGAVIGDSTNDRATFDGVVADVANRTYGFSFTYRVI
jgi:hypothetical protein